MAAGPPIETYTKDPDAVLDYKLDWNDSSKGPWLATGQTISSSTWTVPSGITKDSDTNDTTTTTITLSGGTAGNDYDLINHITTNDSKEDDRTIRIQCRER
jgi:hypothetical protein